MVYRIAYIKIITTAKESISCIPIVRSYADDTASLLLLLLLFDVGVGTVTAEVGARRGADADGVDVSSDSGSDDGVAVVPVLPVVVLFVVGVVALGDGTGVFTVVLVVVGFGVESVPVSISISVPFDPAMKVHVSGQSFMVIHSHGNGKVNTSFPGRYSVAFSVKVDVSHVPQSVKLSIVGQQGALK